MKKFIYGVFTVFCMFTFSAQAEKYYDGNVTVIVGRLNGEYREAIRRAAFSCKVKVNLIEENKNFLNREYYVEFEGPQSAVYCFSRWANSLR